MPDSSISKHSQKFLIVAIGAEVICLIVRLTLVDSSQAAIQRDAKRVFGNVIEGFMENLKEQFPNEEERKRFGKDAFEDFQNSSYHLTSTMYDK